MRIARHLYAQIVDHALEDPEVECCGLVASRNNEAVSVHRCFNVNLMDNGWGGTASFRLDPVEQLMHMERFERDGLDLGAIYHSHPHMEAVPSFIDTRYARNLPGVQWIIVGISQGLGVHVWNWHIDECERIYTAELEVVTSEVGKTGQGTVG